MQASLRFGMDAEQRNLVNLERPDVHLSVGEALMLYATVLANRPRHVFEIGTFLGGSARIIAQAMIDTGLPPRPRSFFMIDPMPRLTPENEAFLADKGTLIAAGSPQALELLPYVDGGFDFAFVDGDHAEEAVYRDLQAVRHHIAPHAIVLCHDVMYVPTDRGVRRAARDFGYVDCGLIASIPTETDQMEADFKVAWGGLRMLRPASTR